MSVPIKAFDESKFTDGHAFDGSSIAGWKGIRPTCCSCGPGYRQSRSFMDRRLSSSPAMCSTPPT
ncbi:MAG: glutamine synthetase [Burkholderiales bacterium]